MKMLSSVGTFLAFVFRRSQLEHEMEQELRSHLQNRADDLEQQGLSRAEAERQARVEFGGYERYKEECREALGSRLLGELVGDVRYGLRQLRRNSGFTVVAILIVALGTGVNTAIFGLLNALMYRRLPVRHPDQLVEIFTCDRSGATGKVSFPLLEEIENRQRVFSGLFAWWGDGVFNVEANGVLSRGDIYAVAGNFYSELGATPFMGRLLTPADVNLRGSAPGQAAVLGYRFWQRNYGGDRAVLGKTVRVEGVPFTVIGVTMPEFKGMGLATAPDVTVPLTAEPVITGRTPGSLYSSPHFWLSATGRLRDGVTLAQARAQMGSFWQEALKATLPPDYNPQQRTEYLATGLDLESARAGIDWYLRSNFTQPLHILMTIAGLILLIACVDLASMMLARAATRSHELGVRVALGASGGRLSRQLLTECVLLSVLGTAAGLALAWWGSAALASVLTRDYLVPSALNLRPDLRVLGFAATVALSAGILFGLAPVWQMARRPPAGALQGGSRTVEGPAGRLGRALIGAQVALSIVLLMVAGLFIRSLQKLRSLNPGFATEGVLGVQLFPRPHGYDALDNFSYYPELLRRVSGLPGVERASVSHFRPGGGLQWQEIVSAGPATPGATADFAMVSPGFFATLDIGLMWGRDFTWQDNDHAPRVAILSQTLARQLFSAGNAIGQRVNIGSEPEWQNLEVVGIVADARLLDIHNPNASIVYVDVLQAGNFAKWGNLNVRTAGEPMALAASVQGTLESLGHEYVLKVKTLEQVKDQALLSERVTAMLAELFGAIALLVAGAGLYGLMAYSVAERTREIGLRMALGAPQSGILWLVARESLAPIAIGLAIGIPLALVAARMVAHMLYGLSSHDPLTLTGALAALITAMMVAGYLPAHRAMNVDPMVALRHE